MNLYFMYLFICIELIKTKLQRALQRCPKNVIFIFIVLYHNKVITHGPTIQ